MYYGSRDHMGVMRSLSTRKCKCEEVGLLSTALCRNMCMSCLVEKRAATLCIALIFAGAYNNYTYNNCYYTCSLQLKYNCVSKLLSLLLYIWTTQDIIRHYSTTCMHGKLV